MFRWEFEAKGPNGFHDNDLELVANFTQESSDLLDETVDGSFISSLEVQLIHCVP